VSGEMVGQAKGRIRFSGSLLLPLWPDFKEILPDPPTTMARSRDLPQTSGPAFRIYRYRMCLDSPKNIVLTSPRNRSVRTWRGEQTIHQPFATRSVNSVPRRRGVSGGGRPRPRAEGKRYRGDTERGTMVKVMGL
jgi:hypothetical protein